MNSITWEEPPESRGGDRRSTKWKTIGDQLRQHPKRWAKVQHYETRPAAASKVTRIQSGQMVGLGDGPWEAKHRGSDNDGWDLYLRFMGDTDDDGVSGQDRESYSDDQDRDSYSDEEQENVTSPSRRPFSDID